MGDVGAFIMGVLIGVVLLAFGLMLAVTPAHVDAVNACKKSGFDGGAYNSEKGFVCFRQTWGPIDGIR